MTDQRIILANDSRLMREMLNRILLKAEHLDVVQQIADPEDLPDAIQQQDAEWIILTMSADNKIPDWTDTYLQKHPFARIMTVSSDGRRVNLKWLDKREQDFPNPTLQELINILEGSLKIENMKKINVPQEVV